MSEVRSVSIGVWLTRGSRHETSDRGGMAHFVEHMLFKGTHTRTAAQIAEEIDSIGGQLDAFTSKEYAAYYIKVLDEHLPLAVDVLSDLVLNPAFAPGDIEKEKSVVVEEIKMVDDMPDDLVHELHTQSFWEGHPLGRPILGTRDTVESFTSAALHDYFRGVYSPRNLIVSAVGHIEHGRVMDLVAERFGEVCFDGARVEEHEPRAVPAIQIRHKELEQSHVCLGSSGYRQDHDDRYATYVLNTLLGGSMSSRLFQNIREKRGLAYAVSSGMSSYRDTGAFTVYAGCANEAVGEVIDLIVHELRELRTTLVPETELRRAKNNLKGSLMLGLESTSSRMSNLAMKEIYFGRQFTLDETVSAVEAVTADDVQRVATDLFQTGKLAATVLGAVDGFTLPRERLDLE